MSLSHFFGGTGTTLTKGTSRGENNFLHLNTLHFDPPRIGGIIQDGLHQRADIIPVRQHLTEGLGSQDVTERGRRQQPRAVLRILHVGDGDGGVADAVVHDSIHSHGYTVFGQDLSQKKINKQINYM